MVSNPRGKYWKASPHFPVGTVNIDALAHRVLQGLNQEFEDAWQCVGIILPVQVVCGGLCKFGGTGNSARTRTAKDPGLL